MHQVPPRVCVPAEVHQQVCLLYPLEPDGVRARYWVEMHCMSSLASTRHQKKVPRCRCTGHCRIYVCVCVRVCVCASNMGPGTLEITQRLGAQREAPSRTYSPTHVRSNMPNISNTSRCTWTRSTGLLVCAKAVSCPAPPARKRKGLPRSLVHNKWPNESNKK